MWVTVWVRRLTHILTHAYPHEMYYVGISSNSTKKRRENGYGHNPELREAIRDAGGIRKIGIYILDEVDDAATAGRLEA